MKVAGLILAAGASSRMGTPKALLHYRGETFLARLRRIFESSCDEVFVVGSPDSAFAVDVVNPAPERGMLSSLQHGLERVSSDADCAIFTLVDLPAITAQTVHDLAAGWRDEPLRLPRYKGKRGHPVLIARRLFPEFLAAQATPKDVLVRYESDIVYMDVDDPGIVQDADTPEEYQKLIANG